MHKRKTYFFNHKIMLFVTVLCLMFSAFAVSADEGHGPWKSVTMAPGVEYTVACRETTMAKICYWWFRNTTDKKITFMYLMRGDGLSPVNQTSWLKNSFLTRKTELTLAPRYAQPIVEGYGAQYVPATNISDARALTVRVDDDTRVPTSVSKDTTSSAARMLAKRDQPLCRANTQVVLGTCRCASGYRASDDVNTNRRTCLKIQREEIVAQDDRSSSNSSSLPAVEMNTALGICGH